MLNSSRARAWLQMVIPGGHKANVDYRTTLERPDGPGSMEGVLGAIPLYMEAGDVRPPTASCLGNRREIAKSSETKMDGRSEVKQLANRACRRYVNNQCVV